MLQKILSRTLDNLSYAYLGTRKKGHSEVFYEGGLDELIKEYDITDPLEFFANPGTVPDVEITKTASRRGYVFNRFIDFCLLFY